VGLFTLAYRKNFGGIADLTDRVFGQVKLGFNAFGQLLSEGAFSGAVMEELNRAENQGLKRFVIHMFQLATRLDALWTGIKEGFVAALTAIEPMWEGLVEAVRRFGAVIGEELGVHLPDLTGFGAKQFRLFGSILGQTLGQTLGKVVSFVSVLARAVVGFMELVQRVRQIMADVVGWITRQVTTAARMVASVFPGVAAPAPVATGGQSSMDAPMSIASPAVAETQAQAASLSGVETLIGGLGRALSSGSPGRILINLVAEGETLARVAHNASRDDAVRSFSPEPAF